MPNSALQPLAGGEVDPRIAALPKADLHVHAEADARLDRLLARRQGRPPYDWHRWAHRLLVHTPPGLPRLHRLVEDRCLDPGVVDALDADPETFVARVVDLLEESAAEGTVLVEVRFGRSTVFRPDFMPLFREAEWRVRDRYPQLRAEAIISGLLPTGGDEDEHLLRACMDAASEGLAGIDFLPVPDNAEVDWRPVSRWAARAASAGLGITAHAGEFSRVNLAAAMRIPGLTRLGHAVAAAADPRLLEELARTGITVECSLSCNVILGAASSYEAHPVRRFVEWGIPVTLNTDDPVRVCTTIGREYAAAAALGFLVVDLLGFTRNAVRASFTSVERRHALLAELHAWEGGQPAP